MLEPAHIRISSPRFFVVLLAPHPSIAPLFPHLCAFFYVALCRRCECPLRLTKSSANKNKYRIKSIPRTYSNERRKSVKDVSTLLRRNTSNAARKIPLVHLTCKTVVKYDFVFFSFFLNCLLFLWDNLIENWLFHESEKMFFHKAQSSFIYFTNIRRKCSFKRACTKVDILFCNKMVITCGFYVNLVLTL